MRDLHCSDEGCVLDPLSKPITGLGVIEESDSSEMVDYKKMYSPTKKVRKVTRNPVSSNKTKKSPIKGAGVKRKGISKRKASKQSTSRKAKKITKKRTAKVPKTTSQAAFLRNLICTLKKVK